jgi:hypothetical protein
LVSLTFDQPATYTGGAPDAAITFIAGYVATAVTQESPYTLRFDIATAPYFGGTWNINSQPSWISTRRLSRT